MSYTFIANLGDASPIEYGGYFLYKNTETGDFEAEVLEEPEDADSRKAKWTIRRVCLDRCKLQRSEDGERVYLVSYKYDPATYPHPLPQYAEWFAKSLDDVADSIGSTREELEELLCSEDGADRAGAYRSIANYHGWENFDSYPLFLTKEEVETRYVDGELGESYRPDDAVLLQSNHLRPAHYSVRKVNCPNAGSYGATVGPGDLIQFAYPSSVENVKLARVLARVDAPSDGPEVKAHTGWIAVVELSVSLGSAFVRWIDPAWVKSCVKIPREMFAWFFAEKLPLLSTVLKLDALGSLSDNYIGKYAGKCERCIVEHGLWDSDRKCTHAAKVCIRCSKPFHENGKERSTHDGDGIDGIDDEADSDHDPVTLEDVELPGSDE